MVSMHHFLEDIWENLLGINSLILWPASLIFLIYASGHAVITLQWKMLLIAAIIFAVDTVVQIVIGIIVD